MDGAYLIGHRYILGRARGVEVGLRDFSLPYIEWCGAFSFLSEFSLWAGCYVGLEPKLKAKRVAGHVQISVLFCFFFSGNFDYVMRARWTKSSVGMSFSLGPTQS
jgi:hypothetical protein